MSWDSQLDPDEPAKSPDQLLPSSLLLGGKLDPDLFIFRPSRLPAFATSPPRPIPSPASSLSVLGTKLWAFAALSLPHRFRPP